MSELRVLRAFGVRVVATRTVAAVVSLLCSSCLVGPDYKPPDASLPPGWPAPVGGGLAAEAYAPDGWWKNLGDPLLDDLVERAVASNRDVTRAVAQVRAARAARSGAVAALFPTLDASVEYKRRRPSASTVSPDAKREFNDYAAGFDSSWEVDLFGGLRRSSEQAAADLEAAGADLDDVLVSVLAELARNYVEYRSLQARITIAEDNARSQGETLDLATWRYQAGLAGALDVDQAEYNLAETRSRIPALETQRVAAANRMAVLLGLPAGSLDAELARPAPVPTPPASVAVGVPTDLLRRRPDVAAAERRLAAATAAIGAAKADLYPKLSLSGTFGVSATDFARLDSGAARGYAIGPTLTWNLFDAGRIRSVVNQRSAEADAALAAWESTVLAAFEEAANALVAFVQEQQRRDRLGEARTAARKAQELARMQYESGVLDFQRVLEAERATLVFEESFAISQASVTSDLVAIYKSLGGGWETVSCSDDGCR
jgi:NodT family efflux transporter outer membrane factor (OMF) lipoprotein